MALYATALETVQLKEETTHGTLVGADTRLSNLKMDIAGNGDDRENYMGSGLLYPGDSTDSIEGSAGTYELPIEFNGTTYVANSVFAKVSPSGTTAKTRLWEPALGAADVYSSYSVEKGQTGAVEKFPWVVFNSMNFTIRKKGQRPVLTGDVMGQEVIPATALTAIATTVASRPVPATAFNVYYGASWAGLESSPTLLTTGWEVEFNYGPRYGPGYFIGNAEPSFDSIGIIVPDNAVNLTLPKDASGSDFAGLLTLAKKRAGSMVYLRLKAEGNQLEPGPPVVKELWQLDLALQVKNLPARTDIDVFTGLKWPLNLFLDSASQKVLSLKTIASS